MFVVVGRRVITAGPHGRAGAGLTLSTSAGAPVRTVLMSGALTQAGTRQGSSGWGKSGPWGHVGGCELLFGDGAVEDTLDG